MSEKQKKIALNKEKIHIFHPWIITINLVLLFFLGNVWSFSFAQTQTGNPAPSPAPSSNQPSDSTETNQPTSSPASSPASSPEADKVLKDRETQCITQMNAFIDEKFKGYGEFMENHFKNKSGTTYLLPDALLKYDEYKQNLMNKLGEFENTNNQNTGANQQFQFQFLTECRKKTQESIDNARKMLVIRTETTSNIKKSTAILDKYKQINGKLRELNLQFLKVKANLGTFSQKLPCYLRKQCTKG
jgi:hypothetical protein